MSELPYSFLRALEIEGRHPEDAGAWGITAGRLAVGEGFPLPGDPGFSVPYSNGAPFPPAPKIDRALLRSRRLAYYKRLQTVRECESFIAYTETSVPVSLELFAGWVEPPKGLIPVPAPGEAPLPWTHFVSLDGYSRDEQRFQFWNSWGPEWGDNGRGYLPYEYYDKYCFNSFGMYPSASWDYYRPKRVGDCLEVRWLTHDECNHRVYGLGICDAKGLERFGWAFVVEREDALEIEDLYVRPEYRGRGYGRRLADQVVELIRAKKKPVRHWIDFADTKQEAPQNYGALVATVQRLRLVFHPCPVNWAAYYATSEKSGNGSGYPIEPGRIPPRPKSSLSALKAAAMVAGIVMGNPAQINSSPPAVATVRQDFPAVGTEAWAEMNQRRAALITKNIYHGLTETEQEEYERLQRLSHEALELAFPRPEVDLDALHRLRESLLATAEPRAK